MKMTFLAILTGLGLGLLIFSLGGTKLYSGTSAVNNAVVADAGSESYPFYGDRFSELIADSYGKETKDAAHQFYKWMDDAYQQSHNWFPGKEGLSLQDFVKSERNELARVSDPAQKARAEVALGAWLHRLVKAIIPRFSLDRGFEFRNVVQRGERQCLLQSVLISGLLQAMGVNAGTVMVYRNIEGQETNNGHAVVLLKLTDGKDILVDASDPQPFAKQQGLLVRAPNDRYVMPVYDAQSATIGHYETTARRINVSTKQARPLDFSFVRSQFWYYRGERAEGALLAAHKTQSGLAAEARYLQKSVDLCPRNALAVYMLGRVYLAQGDVNRARPLLTAAYSLYSQCGWVPDGPRQYLALVNGRHHAGSL